MNKYENITILLGILISSIMGAICIYYFFGDSLIIEYTKGTMKYYSILIEQYPLATLFLVSIITPFMIYSIYTELREGVKDGQ